MKGVFGLTAMFGRIGQGIDDVEEFDDAARPTVGQDDWACVLVR